MDQDINGYPQRDQFKDPPENAGARGFCECAVGLADGVLVFLINILGQPFDALWFIDIDAEVLRGVFVP